MVAAMAGEDSSAKRPDFRFRPAVGGDRFDGR
jgi:hypothetical protein